MVQRHPRLRLRADVAVERTRPRTRRRGSGRGRGSEVGAVGVVAVEAVHLAEGVVQGRVERAGDDERAQRPGSARPAAARASTSAAACEILAVPAPCVRSIGWPSSRAAAVIVGDALDERLHRRRASGRRSAARRERPDVAQRHRAEAAAPSCPPRSRPSTSTFRSVTRSSGDAAELDRRAVGEVLVGEGDVVDADVGGFQVGAAVKQATRLH